VQLALKLTVAGAQTQHAAAAFPVTVRSQSQARLPRVDGSYLQQLQQQIAGCLANILAVVTQPLHLQDAHQQKSAHKPAYMRTWLNHDADVQNMDGCHLCLMQAKNHKTHPD
jgi:hypothetical protein